MKRNWRSKVILALLAFLAGYVVFPKQALFSQETYKNFDAEVAEHGWPLTETSIDIPVSDLQVSTNMKFKYFTIEATEDRLRISITDGSEIDIQFKTVSGAQ